MLLCFHLLVDEPECMQMAWQITETRFAISQIPGQIAIGGSDAQSEADINEEVAAAPCNECCCSRRENDSNLLEHRVIRQTFLLIAP